MDLTILEAIKYIKQISKKKVSLENLLRRINKTNATNIDIDTLRIDVDKSDKDPLLVIITLKIIQQFSLYRLLAHKKRQTLKHKVLFLNTKITKKGSY